MVEGISFWSSFIGKLTRIVVFPIGVKDGIVSYFSSDKVLLFKITTLTVSNTKEYL